MNTIIVSLGCHKNLVDTENMLGILKKNKNINLITDPLKADIAIINTCGFINDAKEESINAILEIAMNKEIGQLKKLIVTGCLAQRYSKELMDEIPEIDAILGTGEIEKIGKVIEEICYKEKIIEIENMEFICNASTERLITTPAHVAYIKIAEGCDMSCSYCIIPKLRGKFRSRSIEDIIKEVENLVSIGVREFNIIAQETTEYGRDIYGKKMLPELLEKISKVDGVKWIKNFYTYPDDFSNELIQVIKNNDNICKYIDIPIQHVSESILKKMKRNSNFEKIENILYNIRKEIPEAVFRTSLIVGFPGETEEDFQKLYDFTKKFEFDYVGIFKYSREEDTAAFDLSNQVDEEIKDERWTKLINLQNDIINRKNLKYIDHIFDVIIDGVSEESEFMLEGRTSFQAYDIDGKVLINDGTGKVGEIVKVKIEQNFDYDLLGGIVENEFTE
ncbi:MAG: 30S ribosomal protein S12 methylthiotransferase RimO [Fusobacteria bacterium]|nr:30S ribosomal protein S12 methylthiotransferase RimO [Fusobacteriota bacterium]